MQKRRKLLKELGPKYQQVLDLLSRDILAGKYKSGQRFPSEAALVRQFGTSRITVGRAVRELKDRGLESGRLVVHQIVPQAAPL